ncbi:peptide-methionine (S)-S-oxide reductase MsrA [Stappia stellulata]|uniref:peptide-methionine (S)-S-oxide reductase MsrA n=1 Tax=Stappia stellulata TaxID=71235 RepID=UPI001CD3DE98|nr:peptide-methionine (S)-S-oxide reductase MsrA [Stappia stellulata]MCA1242981.1 peptide-methionine (S)-S-oxide reductase MsrA [Stappia stellulata]
MSFMTMLSNKFSLVDRAAALPGRETAIMTPGRHAVTGVPIDLAPGEGQEEVLLGLGCFWGAERLFWQLPGVAVTAVGYAGGPTPNPTYNEVCTGRTGHTEVVRVVFDTNVISREDLLRAFWEGHDPTQGMRQGNDTGTQYRSAIYYTTDQMKQAAEATAAAYTQALRAAGHSRAITTEIRPMEAFYFAEEPHQQYLAKNPGGYCGLGGTGVACPAPAPAG